jgi:mandelamide amidase
MNPINLTCTDIARIVASRETTSSEIVAALVQRTQETLHYNAYSSFDGDLVLRAAEEADRAIANGKKLGILHGVPVALKDSINAVGYPTTAGTPGLKGYRPSEDALVVSRLKAAGAIIFGKNNMHELAYGVTTSNAVFGPARNPFDLTRICGGSSGGSAGAVAARTVPASIGTDTGGSVRVPASFCGLWGYRPTVGRWPAAGIVPISRTRDTPGPIARSPSDLSLLDAAIIGRTDVAREGLIDGLRIGIPSEFFWSEADDKVVAVCRRALDKLVALGAVLVEVDTGDLAYHHAASSTPIAFYEGRVTLQEFLVTHDVGRSFRSVVESVACDDVRAILMEQLNVHTAVSEEAYTRAIRLHRPLLQDIYRRLFRDNALDVLAFPTSLVTPPLIGQDSTVQVRGKAYPLFPAVVHNTDVGANAGIPGITIPAGLAAEGLPVGLAFDAPAGADRLLLDVAVELEGHFPALRPGQL